MVDAAAAPAAGGVEVPPLAGVPNENFGGAAAVEAFVDAGAAPVVVVVAAAAGAVVAAPKLNVLFAGCAAVTVDPAAEASAGF